MITDTRIFSLTHSNYSCSKIELSVPNNESLKNNIQITDCSFLARFFPEIFKLIINNQPFLNKTSKNSTSFLIESLNQ